MMLGLAGNGVVPLILGDLNPTTPTSSMHWVGRSSASVGARGYLNVLDPWRGDRGRGAANRHRALGVDRGRARPARHDGVGADDARAQRPSDTATHGPGPCASGPRRAARRHPGAERPARGTDDAPDTVRVVELDRGNLDRYHDVIENPLVSLMGLQERRSARSSRRAHHAEAPLRPGLRRRLRDPVNNTEPHLQGAALMACWSAGFGAVNVAHALADAGKEPPRNYWIVLDEVWRSLRAGLVDNMDGVTRLNRNEGVGQAMITHTMSDLEALLREEDRMKARGFVERAGMVISGALPPSEFAKLRQVMAYSDAEQQMVAGWTNPPAWDNGTGADTVPPGRGNFLVKVGGRPGIPFRVVLTDAERGLHDTNKRWHTRSRIQAAPEFEVTAS